MKKTIWSLAALMLMAATVMTSCSNDIDGVTPAEEVKSNIMTITIAPPEAEPETRVAIDGLTVDGWELNDEVTLYKITGEFDEMQVGDPKTFKCTNVTTGTFTCTDWSNSDDISDYKLAVFGATAANMSIGQQNAICIMPKNKFSGNLKDVVMMAATSTDGNYKMKIINNVVKIQYFPPEDKEVAWYSNGGDDNHPFEPFAPMVAYEASGYFVGLTLHQIPDDYRHQWNDNTHFTITGSSLNGVVYVNMCLAGRNWEGNEKWFLRGEHEHDVLILGEKEIPANAIGKLYTATFN